MSLQISCLPNLFMLLKEIIQREVGDQIILPAVFNTENRLSFWNCLNWTVREFSLPPHIVCIIYPITVFSYESWNEMFSDLAREPPWIVGALLLTGWKPLDYIMTGLWYWLPHCCLIEKTYSFFLSNGQKRNSSETLCLWRAPLPFF